MIEEVKVLSRHAAIYGLSNVLGRAIGFLMIPLYTRYLSPTDYGVLELLDLSMSLLGIVVGVGLADAVARFFFLYDVKEKRLEVVSSAFILLGTVTFVAAGLGLIFGRGLSIVLFADANYSFYVRLCLVGFAFNTLLELPLVYIRAMERSTFYATISLLRLVVGLALNIFLLVYLKYGVVGILYSNVITSILFSGYLFFSVVRGTGLRVNWGMGREMMRFGGPLVISGMGDFVMHFGDRFFLKEVSSMAEVGLYSLGYKFGMMAMSFLIYQPFFLIWSVRRYDVIKQADGERMYGDVFFIFGVALLVCCLALSLFAPEIVYCVADRRFFAAHVYIPIIGLSYVVKAWGDFFKGVLMIEKKTHHLAMVTTIGTVFCIAAYSFFIPRWQGMGAAVATLLTFCVLAVVAFLVSCKFRRIDFHVRKLLLTCLVGVGLWCAGLHIGGGVGGTLVILKKMFLVIMFSGFVIILVGMEKIGPLARRAGVFLSGRRSVKD